jgi:hypothetical protein
MPVVVASVVVLSVVVLSETLLPVLPSVSVTVTPTVVVDSVSPPLPCVDVDVVEAVDVDVVALSAVVLDVVNEVEVVDVPVEPCEAEPDSFRSHSSCPNPSSMHGSAHPTTVAEKTPNAETNPKRCIR